MILPSRFSPRIRLLLRVGVVLGVLVGIHVALHRGLTAEASSRVAALEREFGAARLAAARAPGNAPDAEDPGFAAWRADEALWNASREHREAVEWRRVFRTSILVSCAVQVAIVLTIAARVLRAR